MRLLACSGVIAAISFLVLGCGAKVELPPLGTVTGKVTLDGQPVTNATVTFQSTNGQSAYGNTDASGNYELKFRSGATGAEVGSNTVRIETILDAPPPVGYKDPIPAKYNSQTTLKVDVQAGENTHNFELSSK